jgi:cystathionine beta-synthase
MIPQPQENILQAIGNTPLIKLNNLTKGINSTIFAKCEYFNPAGSIKDRIAKFIIEQAEKRGELKPGSTIIEATSGNTGAGLALVAAIRGYNCIFVMPDKMSQEKISFLQAFGAVVVLCPTAVAPDDPNSYYSVAKRLLKETPNSFYSNQYFNKDNPLAHYHSTGPELWKQTAGKIDTFVVGLGTGGTVSGTGRFLKEQNPKIKIIGIDPVGSLYTEYFKTGKIGSSHQYQVEGIGEDFLPETINFKIIDEVIQINDKESFLTARELVKKEGVYAGGSSGTAVAGAIKYAKTLKKPENIIVLLPDSGNRYLSKVFNDKWMIENGYLKKDSASKKQLVLIEGAKVT